MLKRISQSLNIDILPTWLLVHLLIISFLLGCFNALFFINAFSGLLISGALEFYPQIITGSGIIGVLLFNALKYFFKNFQPVRAFFLLFSILVLLLLLIWFVPFLFSSIWESIMLVALWLPVTIVLEQAFLKVIMDFPVVRKHQNVKRFMEFGIIGGTVFSSITITFLAYFEITVPYLIAGLAILAAVISDFFYVISHYDHKHEVNDEEPVDSLISFFTEIPLKKTVFFLAFFTLLSILTYVFIEYSFLTALVNVYHGKWQIVQFMGFFLAVSMVVNFLFKMFVYQNLIKTFKINKALMLSPLFMVGALVSVNVLMLMPGYGSMMTPYSLVFISIVLVRLFSFLLRESFEFFSLKLFFAAVEIYSKKIIAGFLMFFLNFWAFIFSGLMLLLFNTLDYQMFSVNFIASVGFAFVWLLVAMQLSKNYTLTVSKLIKKLTDEYHPSRSGEAKQLKERMIFTANLSGMRYLMNYRRIYQPDDLPKLHGKDEVARNQIVSNGGSYQPWSVHSDNWNTPITSYDSDESLKINNIEFLAVSVKTKDRLRAVKMISAARDSKLYNILKILLRDPDDEVKRNAIQCAAYNHDNGIIQELLEFLDQEDFSDFASDVLAIIGNDALAALEFKFHKTDIDVRNQRKIIRIIGNIDTDEAILFLQEQLVYPNKWIVLDAANALIEKGSKLGNNDHGLVNRAINNAAGAAAWLLSLDLSLQDINRLFPIRRAIDEEFQVTLDLLFNLLQIKYNDGVIDLVRRSVVSNAANEQRELGVEMLGYVIDKEVKSNLLPLLHNNRKKEKIAQLQNLFPVSQKQSKEALLDIINSDLGTVSLWTKACALDAYIELYDISQSEDIYAHVFNPEPLLSELAFYGITKWNKIAAIDLFPRLPDRIRKKFIVMEEKGDHIKYHLLFHKVNSLQHISYFEHVKGHYLIPLAEVLSEQFLEPGGSSSIKCSEEEVLPVFLVPFGEITLTDVHQRNFKLNRNYLYGLGLYSGGVTFKASTDAMIYLAKPEQLGPLVVNHEELSEALHKYIQSSNFY